MTKNQENLLEQLSDLFQKLSEECINDDKFNDNISELGIFSISIDECMSQVNGMLAENYREEKTIEFLEYFKNN